MAVNIQSDIGKLRKVIVHRPGAELLNLVPEYLHEQLFDDIPFLAQAATEHDYFVNVMKQNGVQVFYFKDMLCEVLSDKGRRELFTDRFLAERDEKRHVAYSVKERLYYDRVVRGHLESLDCAGLADAAIGGLRIASTGCKENADSYPFLLDPMPNMYFSRDPFFFLGKGAGVSRMFMYARRRETLLSDFIIENHPEFKGIKKYYRRDAEYSIEGGDVMALGNGAVAVGVSQRTQLEAVMKMSEPLLDDFKAVIAVTIPNERTFMHLDTVFTMVDKDKFAVYAQAVEKASVMVITKKGKEMYASLTEALCDTLNLNKVTYIHCGGADSVDGAREQWNDGANTLALDAGKIIVYNRNPITNRLFVENGIEIHEIPCSEVSRGRGGPHCMSMPFYRD